MLGLFSVSSCCTENQCTDVHERKTSIETLQSEGAFYSATVRLEENGVYFAAAGEMKHVGYCGFYESRSASTFTFLF